MLPVVKQLWSPNWSPRRPDVPVDTIVLHGTAGGLLGSLGWLTNRKSQVSAHYLIAKNGMIYKLVPTNRSAWHAGKNCVGFSRANQRSVGIELEQYPKDVPTEEQMQSLRWLVRQIMAKFGTIRYLVGHHEINPKKTDPWNLSMDSLRKEFGLWRPRREVQE